MSRTTEGRREGDWIVTPTGKRLYRGSRAVQSAVPMAEATPMIVTAETPHGVSAAGAWPLMLDGILAGVAHRGHADIGVVDHHVPTLPLVRSRGLSETFQGGDRAGRGRKQWWWMASAGMFDRDVTDVRWWHSRLNDTRVNDVASDLPATLLKSGGRYKGWRMLDAVTVTRSVTWFAVGDADLVRAMLANVPAIGDARSRGEGAVTRWTVSVADIGPSRLMDWFLPFGEPPCRPIPFAHADALGFPDRACELAPTRPPYFRPPMTETGRRVMPRSIHPEAVRGTR